MDKTPAYPVNPVSQKDVKASPADLPHHKIKVLPGAIGPTLNVPEYFGLPTPPVGVAGQVANLYIGVLKLCTYPCVNRRYWGISQNRGLSNHIIFYLSMFYIENVRF
jgi:hypothetical protein